MAQIRLEVAAPGAPAGAVLHVTGNDRALGEWDLARAIPMHASQAAADTWMCQVPLPTGGGEFKFVFAAQGGSAHWEPLNGNRAFPTTGLGPDTLLRMKFGEAKMAIEASKTQIEASARAVRKLEDRKGSALDANVQGKGEFAYYHAHTRTFEVPEDAKVISGPGLITGGAPVLLEAGGNQLVDTTEERVVWLKDYSWSDGTGKVKVYVPVAQGLLPADGATECVQTNFAANKVELTINCKPMHRLTIEKLNAELNVESCSTRVEAHKNRIVLQLAKKRETTWHNLTKSK